MYQTLLSYFKLRISILKFKRFASSEYNFFLIRADKYSNQIKFKTTLDI